MFHTLTGSLIILLCMLAIIGVFAIFMATVLTWIFLTDTEAAGTSTVQAPSTTSPLRKAA